MGVDRPIDITADQRQTILALLERYLPNTAAWVYGSRVAWTSRPQSDLDMVVFATPEQNDRVAEIREAFEESDLPFRVDLFVWNAAPEEFRKRIEEEHVVLVGKEEADSGWHKTNLGELLSFSNGKSSPKRFDSATNPVYGSNGIIGFSDKTNAIPKTIIVGRVGSYCGSLHYSDRVCWVTDNAIQANALDENNAKFLFYLLKTLQLNTWRTGSGQPLLNQTILSSIPAAVPNPTEQRAIAHILGTLDDKIELNQRMNETLEAMARALFKSWFVDFDPVRAKMEGRWRPGESLPSLPAHLYDLFPDRLVESELGEAPEGWEVGTLGNIANASRRGVHPEDMPTETPYIGLEHMPRRSIALVEWGNARKIKSSKSIFEKGDILFGRLRPYFHKVGIAPVQGICSTDIVVIVPQSAEWLAFTLACVSSIEFVNYTNQTATGTKMPRTSWKTMSRYSVCLPPTPVAQAFQNAAKAILEHIVTNIHEVRKLAAIRDVLLPKLISGELRIKETEKII